MRFIGDIHGNKNAYLKAIGSAEKSVQVGDYGAGFVNFGFDDEFQSNHRFIRGNHDSPEICRMKSGWIPDGTVEGDMMFVGGAKSIDRAHRIEGVSWWPDEELSYAEFQNIFDIYLENKPRVMVTHECPEVIADVLVNANRMTKFNDPSITRQAFSNMWENHKPEIWVFGHWHVSFDKTILGTRFVCLNINEAIDINI